MSLVRSQGGSWFGSGRPKVSRKSEGTRLVQISRARLRGGAASKASATSVTSEIASSKISAQTLPVVAGEVARVGDVPGVGFGAEAIH